MRILIGGASGDIGVGCARILRNVNFVTTVIGFDICAEPWNEYYLDDFHKSPRADAPEFIDWLCEKASAIGVDVYIPTSEAELMRLSKSAISTKFSGRVLMLDSDIALTCLDKALCMKKLKEGNLPVPMTGIADRDEPISFPVILKPRTGRGSQKIRFVKNRDSFLSKREVGDIWQTYVPKEEGEYTSGVFRAKSGEFRCITFRRELRGGRTVSGEIVHRSDFNAYLLRAAEIFNLYGAFNVQFRVLDGAPIAFEINPRLSSTLVFRDKLGFQDLRWWLSDVLGRPIGGYSPPHLGTRFFRGDAETFLQPKEHKDD